MYKIVHNGKIVETHDGLRAAVYAFWILTAHELKNGRTANLELDTRTEGGVPPPEQCSPALPEWAIEVLREHGAFDSSAIKLTGVTREACGWGTPNEVKPGDAVDESVYWEMLEVVPPATHKADLMQMGETMDHKGTGDRPRYLTLQKHAGQWIYTGVRVRGERVKLET